MRKPIDIETLWRLERAGAVSLSPDGSAAVCSVTSYKMEDNKGRTALWLLPTASCSPRRLTTGGEKDGNPAWSPQGDRIAFLAKREQDGRTDAEPQLYVIPAAGGEAERKSDFAPGIDDFKWMPDGKRIVFVSWVWPDAKGAREQAKRHKKFTDRKESAYVTSEAHYRHWDRNLPMGRVPHLLMLDLASGRVTDLFEGTGYELPRVDTCAAHFDISPDGRRIAFVHDPIERKRADHALALAEIHIASRRITPLTDDPRWSYDAPRYGPDGSSLACVAAHVGRRHTMPNRLAIRNDHGLWRMPGAGRDLDVDAPLRWSGDGASILFTAQERGRRHLWRQDLRKRAPEVAVQGGWVQGFDIAGSGSDEIITVAIDCASHPVQIHAVKSGAAKRLERFNYEVLSNVAIGETREVTVKGALGDAVQMFLTFPPRFNAKRKHPVMQVIHGGPYAASGDTWGYRWNTHLLASRGHVLASVNYHGSSGFGHAFADSIMGRMGQLELRDIEAGTDWLLKQRWCDRKRVYAGGGSYGGFLVAWMNGHVAPGRYRNYVCHAGVFDRVATFSADSYIQRPRDLGALYWKDPAKVLAQSPHTFAHRMRTPTLILHGTKDYRVPDVNGLAYYNTLLAQGVPTRLVWFPDENHWVLKPRNSRLWYSEVLDWVKK
ncbi:alpha/beta hydrolase family protein [Usitatibacter palustris]|uniref:Dipeptidyl-peptidase 5 n=1 Tax=Usitatibacter palustris TaxID=2732487 RepID=A0A6M4H6V1_9PROT|nr:S9 family peptidase [Usitatibacter palustris]QJR15349.1 Dipeptidyl-peptidase 5 [Usitatibacter palustris]